MMGRRTPGPLPLRPQWPVTVQRRNGRPVAAGQTGGEGRATPGQPITRPPAPPGAVPALVDRERSDRLGRRPVLPSQQRQLLLETTGHIVELQQLLAFAR